LFSFPSLSPTLQGTALGFVIGPLALPDGSNFDLLDKLTWLYWGENIALLVAFVILVVKFESKPPTPPTLCVLGRMEGGGEEGRRKREEGRGKRGEGRGLNWHYWGENIALLVAFVILVVKFESKPTTPPTLCVWREKEGRGKREVGRRKRGEGRGKKEEGRGKRAQLALLGREHCPPCRLRHPRG
jgi:hypothetical protein